MEFNVGDFVFHRSDGLCKIISIEDREGESFYKLETVSNFHDIIYCPINTDNHSFRRLMSKEEIENLIAYVKTITTYTDAPTSKKRREKFKELLYSNNPMKLGFLAKSISIFKKQREDKNQTLSQEDRFIYKKVHHFLESEISLVLNIKEEEVSNLFN